MEICIDDREPATIIKYLRKKFPEVTFVSKRMKEGDYRGKNVIVERKTIGDLHASILDGRFTSQFNRMCAIPDTYVILLVTGSLESYAKMMRYKKITVNREMILNTISSSAYRYGASILWSDDEEEGLAILIPIMMSIINGSYMTPTKAHPHILLSRLLQLPKKTLLLLLEEYKTIDAIAGATEADLMKVKGIGETRAKTIKKVLNEEL